MKSTTKILIGILLSGAVVMVVGTILYCTLEWPKDQVLFDGKPVSMVVAPFHAVKVCVEESKELGKNKIVVEGDLSILPVVGTEHRLSYPAGLERYFSVVTKNDTLYLTFKASGENAPNELRNKEFAFLVFSKMTLTADSSLVAIQSDANVLSINLLKLKADSISLNTPYLGLKVDSCDFRAFTVVAAERVKVENSRIHSTYLDLDRVSGWRVSNCQLENEYLTGSRTYYRTLKKGECKQVYWQPKKEDAQLNLSIALDEAARVSVLN